MTRRRILLLVAVALMAAAALAWYLPSLFSPIPGLVAEVQACLAPIGDDVDAEKLPPDANALIQIDMQFIGFNMTLAGTTIRKHAKDQQGFSSGVVYDDERLRVVLEQLSAVGCVRVDAESGVMTSSGIACTVQSGGQIAVVGGDGVVHFKLCGTAVEAVPTLCKDGRIHVQLDLTHAEPLDPVVQVREGAAHRPPAVLKARTAVVLHDGHTCFIGGPTRKQRTTEEIHIPVLSDLPAIGSSFNIRRDVDAEWEQLILVTVRRAARVQ